MIVKLYSGVIRLQTEEVDTYIRFQVWDKDPQRQIIVFWQCGSDQMYYLGTVRLNDKDKQWYVILDDLSTEFTMEEVMNVFNEQFEIQNNIYEQSQYLKSEVKQDEKMWEYSKKLSDVERECKL